MHILICFIELVFVVLPFPDVAFAYIDPGAGDQVHQILLAAVIALVLSVKWWGPRLAGWRRKNNGEKKDPGL